MAGSGRKASGEHHRNKKGRSSQLCHLEDGVEIGRVQGILRRKFGNIPASAKTSLPEILSEERSIIVLCTAEFLLVYFFDDTDKTRIEQRFRQKLFPFPGLIAENEEQPVAFQLNGSRNVRIEECKIQNLVALRLGKDSTVILKDLSLGFTTADENECKYTVRLAYLLSFGKEIKKTNVYEFLEDLIAYSINEWRSANDRKTS